MALRRDDPYLSLADEYLSRGEPEPQPRSSTPSVTSKPAEPTQEEIDTTRRRRSLERTGETERAFNQGVAGVRSGLVAMRGLLRGAVGDEVGSTNDLTRAVQLTQDAAEYAPRVGSVEDIGGVGDALEYARNIAVEQIPNIAVIAGTGGLAGGARAAAGGLARRAAIRAAGERAAVRAAAEGATIARGATQRAAQTVARRLPPAAPASNLTSNVAAAGAGSTLQAGQVAEAALDDTQGGTQQERALKALTGAVATGGLEALPIQRLMRRIGLGSADEVARHTATGGLATRVAKQAAKQGLEEAGTEVAQTFGELATHKWINDNQSVIAPEQLSQYINAAVGGLVGGAIFGAPTGLRGAAKKDPAANERVRAGLRESWQKVGQVLNPAPPPPVAKAGETPSLEADFQDKLHKQRVELRFNSATSILEADDTDAFGENQTFSNFVDNRRMTEIAQRIPDQRFAAVASALPDDATVDALQANGGLEAAVNVLFGVDPSMLPKRQQEGLRQYFAALPEDKADDFHRFAAVLDASRKYATGGQRLWDDIENISSAASESEQTGLSDDLDYNEREGTAEITAADLKPEDRAAITNRIFRAGRGTKVSRGLPPSSLTMSNGQETRQLNFADAYRALREQDPDTAQSLDAITDSGQKTRAQVAAVAQVLGEQGWNIDPASIRPGVTFGQGWELTPQTAAMLRQELSSQAPAPRVRGIGEADTAATEFIRREVMADQQRAVDDEDTLGYDIEQEQGAETVDQAVPPGTPVLPGQGSPSLGGRVENRAPRGQAAGPSFQKALNAELARSGLREEGGRIVRANGRPVAPGIEATIRAKVERQIAPVERVPANPTARPFNNERTRKAERRGQRDARLDTRTLDSGEIDSEAAKEERRLDRTLRSPGAIARAVVNVVSARSGPARGLEERNSRFFEAIDKIIDSGTQEQADKLLDSVDFLRSRSALYLMYQRYVEQPSGPTTLRRAELARRVMDRWEDLRAEITVASNAQSALPGRDVFVSAALHNEQTRRAHDIFKNLAGGKKTVKAEDYAAEILPHMKLQQRRLVKAMLDSGALRGVRLNVEPTEHNTHGIYNPDADQVTLSVPTPELRNPSLLGVDLHAVLVHELTHAATLHAEARNPAARKDLNKLLNHVRDAYEATGGDPSTWYGMSDTQEFLAEAFGNPRFQDVLRRLPPANTDTFKNAWQEFLSWVSRVLGMDGKQQATALEEVLTLGAVLTQEAGMARMSTFARIFNGTAPNVFNSAHAHQPTDWLSMLSPDDRAYLVTAFQAPEVFNKISKGMPVSLRTKLRSVDEGPALLINTGVAMVLDGRLDLKGSRGPVGRLWDVISKSLQVPSANVYAEQILSDIRAGNITKGYQASSKTTAKATQQATAWMRKHVRPVTDALLKNMHDRVRERNIPALNSMATLVARRTGEFRASDNRSYRQEWETQRSKFFNELARIKGDLDERQERILVRSLQAGRLLPKYKKELGKTYDQLRAYLDGMYDYMTQAGVTGLGRRENYFPVAMDPDAVAKRKDQFFELHRAKNLEQPIRQRFAKWVNESIRQMEARIDDKPLSKADADRLDALIRREAAIMDGTVDIEELIGDLYEMAVFGGREHYIAGVNFADSAHSPAFSSMKPRTSAFIYEHGTPEQIREFSKFQKTNLFGILSQYTNRSTRRAEWERLRMTDQITGLMEQARGQGATAADLQLAQDFLNMEMGTYHDNWNPVVYRMFQGIDNVFNTKLADIDFQKWKGIQSAIMTYNNVRLLPLALVSSFVDPLGPMIRSGGVNGALSNLRDAFRGLRNVGGQDELRAMADTMGIIEREGLGDIMAHLYGGTHDPDSRVGKINNALFKYNGMDAMLRFTRLTALAAGHRFLIRHKNSPNEHSQRYLDELGLSADDITVAENGKFVVLTPKVQAALRQFVDESTVRPTPAQKPGWHNDPNFNLASQYKGYLYAFYETVLRRAYLEVAQHGNAGVMVPLLMYLPVTMAAEMMRDMAQGDDEDKEAMDYLTQSVERSGLMGPRAGVVTEASTNVQYGTGLLGNFAGPTGQQIGDAYDVLTGDAQFTSVAVEALPGQALYREWGD